MFAKKKNFEALAFLFLASLLLNYFYIHLDPFLNSWDERFHALVAKNMLDNPFKPTLYKTPILPYDFKNWSGNHIWLHKQPLFLWQMAIAIKILGVSEIAIRVPSAIMVSILVLVLFRIGKLIFNENVGFVAAVLMASNNFILEHVSGKQQVEHNDVAFMFYVILSIWSWIEFERSNNKWWLLLMGLFAGCGILIKWVTALLVYSGFAFYRFFIQKNFFRKETLFNTLLALCITFLIAAPWQFFILTHFPTEAKFEYAFNAKHFSEVIENHGGPFLFYWNEIRNNFSQLQLLIFFGAIIVLVKRTKYSLAVPLVFMAILFYLFFSLAQTKMTSFVMPVAPLFFLIMGVAVEFVWSKFSKKNMLQLCLVFMSLAILLFRNLNISKISDDHWRNPEMYWGKFLQNTADNTNDIYKDLPRLLNGDYVIAFCNQFEEIDCMFYSGYTAYPYLTEDDFNKLKMSGKKIAVFGHDLPEYVLKDTSVTFVPCNYKRN